MSDPFVSHPRTWSGDRTAYRTSVALAVVAGAAGVCSFFFWRLFDRDVPMTVGNMRGTALTVFALAVPLLAGAMWDARRGAPRALFVWLGALGYLAYNAVMFCFTVRFNSLFLLFAAMLSLSFWALIARLRTLNVDALAQAAARVPARGIALYLFVCTAAWSALWLSSIVPSTLSNTMPPTLTEAGLTQNTVWVLDFAFSFPLMVIGGLWIWRRRPWGYVIAGTMTIMLTLETAGVFVDQLFGHMHDASASLGALVPLAVFTVAGGIASTMLLSAITVSTRATRAATP